MPNWPDYRLQEQRSKHNSGRGWRFTVTITTTAPCGHTLKVNGRHADGVKARALAETAIHNAIRDEVRKCGGAK